MLRRLTPLALSLAATLAAALTVALTAAPAQARQNWAILIGAAQYDNLDPKFWLKGPGNDVALVRRFLLENPHLPFDPAHVLVLADDLPGAPRATLEAIREAFATVTAQAQPGDFVYLHFSGHGSQAPALDPASELDGLDELFLPVDIGPWDDGVGHVENALVDDEIGALIGALRQTGAEVWAVFDACHSGTATRAAPTGEDEEVALRQLSPEALGIPDRALDAAEAAAQEAAAEAGGASRGMDAPGGDGPPPPVDLAAALPSGPVAPGPFVAFYAAQTTETTPEKRLPKGDPDRQALGVFTWTIFETLAERPDLTYRQLAQEVLRRYAVFNLTRTTPMFEGDLDRAVFGLGGAQAVQQWPAQVESGAVSFAAGRLHGLQPGERLAVLAAPADPLEAALGWLTAERVETFSTLARPEDGLDLSALPRGAVVRKVAAELDYTLTVALPEGEGAPAAMMRAAAAALAAGEEARLRFVEPGAEDADLRLAVLPDSPRPDAIWMLPGTGLIEAAAGADLAQALAAVPSVSTADKTPGEFAAAIGENLTRMARALNLMKLGTATDGAGLGVTTELRRARYDESSETLIAPGSRQPLSGANVPRLRPDDVLGARIENGSAGAVDFNILYVGADYSIGWIANGRMNPGEVLDDDYILIDGQRFGRDRLVIVLTPAEPGTATEDLSFLAQDEVPLSRGGMSGIEAALREAGFGETTRSAVALKRKSTGETRRPMIVQYELDAVPQ